MKKYLHQILPMLILVLYFVGLIVVLVAAIVLLPITFLNWALRHRDMQFRNLGPSFVLLEKYWKILAEK